MRSGQPTAIFEDPCPFFARNVPATSMPRTPPRSNPMMMMPQQQPLPKGNIGQLWTALGVNLAGDEVLYQAYNPYPKLADILVKEFVFINRGMDGVKDPFNDANPITSKLQQVLLPFPGSITKLPGSKVELTLADGRTAELEPRPVDDWPNPERGFEFQSKGTLVQAKTWASAVRLGGQETVDSLSMVVNFLRKLKSGQVSFRRAEHWQERAAATGRRHLRGCWSGSGGLDQ